MFNEAVLIQTLTLSNIGARQCLAFGLLGNSSYRRHWLKANGTGVLPKGFFHHFEVISGRTLPSNPTNTRGDKKFLPNAAFFTKKRILLKLSQAFFFLSSSFFDTRKSCHNFTSKIIISILEG